jgi:hypothetical protein
VEREVESEMKPRSRRTEVLETLRFAGAVIVLLIEALARLRKQGETSRAA